jgi:transposase
MMTVYIGIDWSEKKHDGTFLNEEGQIIGQVTMNHTPEGLLTLEKTRQYLGVEAGECLVGLETAHNLVIDFLWARSYGQIYVIPPNVVKSSRGRYNQSGARTDQHDSRLLADLLRTDRARLHPWRPDSLLTRQIGVQVRFINDLTRQIVARTNRLRAVLLRYYPAALNVFSALTGQVTLRFLLAYPTPAEAKALSWTEFEAFALAAGYPQPKKLSDCYIRLQQLQLEASAETVLIYQNQVPFLAKELLGLVEHKKEALTQLSLWFSQHPDQAIFASLPGLGPLLAPALLAKFGDDRERFPSPASVQALAGTCPVTDQSGQRRLIKFRHACDHEFRHLCQQWARLSLRESLWAKAYWQQIRPRCHSEQHAYRCLANRWLAVAWKLWHSGQTYDQSYHLQQRMLRAKAR